MFVFIKKYPIIILLIFIPLLFLFPLFHSGLYVSHDGEAHVARFAAYYQAFADKQFPPRWAGHLNYRYGSPLFIFYYPLPGYIGSLFHFLGLSFEQSYLLLMAFCFIFAPVSFYFWSRTFLKESQAVLAAFLYGLAPYHFLDLFVRGDIAEMLAFVFIPLVFLCIDKMLLISDSAHSTLSFKYSLTGSIFFGLLILSHNGISLMFTPLLFCYVIFSIFITKKWGKIIPLSLMFFFGFGVSAFFWMPALLEKKYILASFFIGDIYRHNFPSLLTLIFSAWGFEPDVNKPGGLSPQIGIWYIGLSMFAVFFWVRSKRKEITSIFWLVVFLIGIFMTVSFSSIIWQHVALLRLFEFSWRFTALSSFASVMLGCLVLKNIQNKKILFILAVLFFISCFPFVKVKGYTYHTDNYYFSYSGSTYYHGEASTVWTAGDPSSFPKNPVEIIEGQGRIEQVSHKSQVHVSIVHMRTSGRVLENTIYFPGWRAYSDGKLTPIEFQDILHRGLITFPVSKGDHTITLLFKETYDRWVADSISLLSLVVIIFGIIITKFHTSHIKQS